jgi:hypothetical protein
MNITLTAYTNDNFSYTIETTGTKPIRYSISNQPAGVTIIGNTINGKISQNGTYTFEVKAQNNFGYDTKNMVVTIIDAVGITSKLSDSTKVSNPYTYTIESTGSGPKTYEASPLPSGLTLSENKISGTPTITGITNIIISLTAVTQNSIEYTSEVLSLSVSEYLAPIITSNGSASGLTNISFEYTITCEGDSTFSVIGILPPGLTFSTNKISGTPTKSGQWNVILKAVNAFGENTKSLTITISVY